jgi:phospholipase/carboxylesterase
MPIDMRKRIGLLALVLASVTGATTALSAFGASKQPASQISRNTMPPSILIHKPAGAPQRLFLLFHGVGSNAQDLVPVGQQFATKFPDAMVVSVEGLQASDFGQGRQWFSVAGITEESRPARVATVMPAFQALIEQIQKISGVSAEKTTLIGFSQGSIMALESTQHAPTLAGRVIAFSGRFAKAPVLAPKGTVIHLIHGDADQVISVEHSRNAASQLHAMGANVSLDIEPGMGHGIDARMISLALGKVIG